MNTVLGSVVRAISNVHVLVYRLSGGRAPLATSPTLLLTTAGRKSGTPRIRPLAYVADGDRFIVAAGSAGSARHPAWFLNLEHHPYAVVQVRQQTMCVCAVRAAGAERAAYWRRLVARYPRLADYQARTQREIPVVILQPMAQR